MHSESGRTVVERLQARQPEIEAALLSLLPDDLRDPRGGADAEFTYVQREAVVGALDYALKVLAGVPPQTTLALAVVVRQARCSARHAVSLEDVLGLYIAGREILGDIIAEEAEQQGIGGRKLQIALGSLLQQLVPIVTHAYQGERDRLDRSPQQRRAELVRRLLAGKRSDPVPLCYEFDAWHTAMIISGSGTSRARSHLEGYGLGETLSIRQDETTVWAWVGGSSPVAARRLEQFANEEVALQGWTFAIGEPALGISGWRLTHRLAQEARRVALLARERVAMYADVGVLAPWALDRESGLAFIRAQLGPLDSLRDGGVDARESLRAIFGAGHQIGSAASALKIDRGTLRARLRLIEKQLGFSVQARQAELEIALRLEALYDEAREPPLTQQAHQSVDITCCHPPN